MKRTKYTTEFKLEAVKQILEKGHSATDVASRLGVPMGLLYTWTGKLKGSDEKPIEDVCPNSLGQASFATAVIPMAAKNTLSSHPNPKITLLS